MYPDGVFAWQFHYDFHDTGRAYLKSEGDSGPWTHYGKPGRDIHHLSERSVFPLRSLIPVKMDGLIGAQGNVGFSSIVSSACVCTIIASTSARQQQRSPCSP
jgi:hypothetical protein